jgi:hypothetical protein
MDHQTQKAYLQSAEKQPRREKGPNIMWVFDLRVTVKVTDSKYDPLWTPTRFIPTRSMASDIKKWGDYEKLVVTEMVAHKYREWRILRDALRYLLVDLEKPLINLPAVLQSLIVDYLVQREVENWQKLFEFLVTYKKRGAT